MYRHNSNGGGRGPQSHGRSGQAVDGHGLYRTKWLSLVKRALLEGNPKEAQRSSQASWNETAESGKSLDRNRRGTGTDATDT